MPVTCPKCAFVNATSELLECPKCGIIYSKFVPDRPTHAPPAPVVQEEDDEPETPLKVEALALPVAFAGAILAKLLVLPGMLFWYFFTIPTHELGHTLVAWAGGHVAIPLGALIPMAGFTTVYPNKSSGVVTLDFLLLAALAYVALRNRRPYLLVLGVVAAFFVLQLSFGTTDRDWAMRLSWGGIAGEFWISTLFILSFFYRFPPSWRWDFVRFFFLVPGAWTFFNTYWRWFKIDQTHSGFPLGSFLNGQGDSGGDMQKVIDFGWSIPTIISSYMTLGNICLVLIVGHYAYFLSIRLARKR
jgi:hypothetical protein